MNNIYKFSSYLTENTHRLHHKDEAINVVKEIVAVNREKRSTKYSVRAECRDFKVLQRVVHIITTVVYAIRWSQNLVTSGRIQRPPVS